MTRKEYLLKVFKTTNLTYTCTALCKMIIRRENIEDTRARYLSGSISSILRKLYLNGLIDRVESYGPKGGYGYKKLYHATNKF